METNHLIFSKFLLKNLMKSFLQNIMQINWHKLFKLEFQQFNRHFGNNTEIIATQISSYLNIKKLANIN